MWYNLTIIKEFLAHSKRIMIKECVLWPSVVRNALSPMEELKESDASTNNTCEMVPAPATALEMSNDTHTANILV
jgi:hypothetical protein